MHLAPKKKKCHNSSETISVKIFGDGTAQNVGHVTILWLFSQIEHDQPTPKLELGLPIKFLVPMFATLSLIFINIYERGWESDRDGRKKGGVERKIEMESCIYKCKKTWLDLHLARVVILFFFLTFHSRFVEFFMIGSLQYSNSQLKKKTGER